MPTPIYYTFGNHMHWVDMEWLWGYHVLPGSVRDMIHLCREAGVKGCVNFDGIGYEKMAAEDPEALLELRAAVLEGLIEPVGCSYGQPYGLFHGGESNIRQLIYGARAVRRLLGVWPKTFWEEEFYFFPQLPQMLAGCGFTGASLFFQWTWHTPEVPHEDSPVVWWEGLDGTRILTATRNRLNMHQWPEDMDAVLKSVASASSPMVSSGVSPELIQQWLELMPSPDWMCRSELILPKLKELLADPRFEVRPVTLGEYLARVASDSVASASSPMVSSGVSPESNKGIDKRQGAYLPHWRRDGATYAVTFRLADSLPKEVQAEYAAERERLQELHDSGRLTSDALRYEYLRLRSEKVEDYLDAGHGSCILREPSVGQLVFEALRHFDGERYALAAAVVMPNHVHVVVQPFEGHDLGAILHSWKSFTSHLIGRGPIWQLESYDHLIRDRADLARQIRYVAENPVQSGLHEWPWLYVNESFLHERDAHVNHRRDADATASGSIPVRRYTMDQVWHGMTLGKNGDEAVRMSHSHERSLRLAETLYAIHGLFGRPYPNWDCYPVWEMEDGWRHLLAAQHHDNHECEGLCGYVADTDYTVASQRSDAQMVLDHLARRMGCDAGDVLAINPFSWPIRGRVINDAGKSAILAFEAYELRRVPESSLGEVREFTFGQGALEYLRGDFLCRLEPDPARFVLSHDGGVTEHSFHLGAGFARQNERVVHWRVTETRGENFHLGDGSLAFWARIPAEEDVLELTVSCEATDYDPGISGAQIVYFSPSFALASLIADTPYGFEDTRPGGAVQRKYPSGDWMTSPQWFETVEGMFTSLSAVDMVDRAGGGLCIAHNGSMQWSQSEHGIGNLVGAIDPWDEDRAFVYGRCTYRIHGHKDQAQADRYRAGQKQFGYRDWDNADVISHTLDDRSYVGAKVKPSIGDMPPAFSPLTCQPTNVVVTAFYREAEDFAGKHVENYAGTGMGYPFIVRLVEFDGIETDVELTIVGPVARAYKTNLLGQIECELDPTPQPPPRQSGEGEFQYDTLRFKMRAHEIATLYLDIVPGRKQARDLDAKREVWATVHRHKTQESKD